MASAYVSVIPITSGWQPRDALSDAALGLALGNGHGFSQARLGLQGSNLIVSAYRLRENT